MAYDGNEVRVHDNSIAVLNKVYLRLSEDRRMLREDGFLLHNDFIGDVYCFSNIQDAVRGADFVFESVAENIAVKKEVFRKMEASCGEDTVVATSSMRLSIDEIFEGTNFKERALGVRFLYPVYFIPEVELLPSKFTSLETLEKGKKIVCKLNTLILNDSPNLVRQFLERMNRVAFFRSGNEPIVLNEEQREARKAAFLRQLNDKNGITRCLNLPVPDLGSAKNTNQNETANESSNDPMPFNREKECVVCMDSSRDCVLHPCHHLCTCIKCGRLLLKRQDACPICRRSITNAFRVYHS
ncbi:3-hydroxybutyryl-CoA dehydrogenase-like protein [Dinothrombium tinctorium]|uniref:3-hydroxybutyryl-CoA dehydrogenase-like protein n=1 Tax=Dinothrombium tinctorium TaxID=1965070 RepID=A0A3S3PGP5_9ACAR|nr:3-hydroxybutyryl-CoA dehydrogenase-like protein [Dinothrombium tinctorium]